MITWWNVGPFSSVWLDLPRGCRCSWSCWSCRRNWSAPTATSTTPNRRRKRMPADFGDVPTWFGAVTSTLALGAAAVAARVAHRVYKIESKRDERADGDRRQAAADARRAQAD